MLQAAGQDFINQFMGFSMLIVSEPFQKAITNESDPNHAFAKKTAEWLMAKVPEMQAIMAEGIQTFGVSQFDVDIPSLLGRFMQGGIGL